MHKTYLPGLVWRQHRLVKFEHFVNSSVPTVEDWVPCCDTGAHKSYRLSAHLSNTLTKIWSILKNLDIYAVNDAYCIPHFLKALTELHDLGYEFLRLCIAQDWFQGSKIRRYCQECQFLGKSAEKLEFHFRKSNSPVSYHQWHSWCTLQVRKPPENISLRQRASKCRLIFICTWITVSVVLWRLFPKSKTDSISAKWGKYPSSMTYPSAITNGLTRSNPIASLSALYLSGQKTKEVEKPFYSNSWSGI